MSRGTVHRRLRPRAPVPSRPTPARALGDAEKQRIVDVLCSERFVDRSPAEVVYTLLDEGDFSQQPLSQAARTGTEASYQTIKP